MADGLNYLDVEGLEWLSNQLKGNVSLQLQKRLKRQRTSNPLKPMISKTVQTSNYDFLAV